MCSPPFCTKFGSAVGMADRGCVQVGEHVFPIHPTHFQPALETGPAGAGKFARIGAWVYVVTEEGAVLPDASGRICIHHTEQGNRVYNHIVFEGQMEVRVKAIGAYGLRSVACLLLLI